jgi:hypothetical protein
MKRLLRWFALAASSGACVAAFAAPAEAKTASPAASISRQLVEQKLDLMKRVLSDSPAARRIEASSNAAAKKYLASAQENYRSALSSIKNNDLLAADKQLNDATALMGKARHLVPDPLTRSAEQRAQFTQMLDSVESLRVSYQGQVQRARPQRGEADDALLAKAAKLVDRARNFAQAEQLALATKSLAEAQRALMIGLGRVLGSKTVEYAQRFESPAEEYAFELERNRSYADLIPIAMDAFRPGADAAREARHLVDGDRGLREQAQRHAAARDYRAALTALRSGTTQLQNALASVGLRVPQEP